MKSLLICLLLATTLFGQRRRNPKDNAEIEAMLKDMEREWSQAGVEKDLATIQRIMAPDWISVDVDGKEYKRADAIAALEVGTSQVRAVEQKEFKVRIFGKDCAVVYHTDIEQSTYLNHDTSGKYKWMDVWMKRNGQWQVVASQTIKVQ